MTDVLQKQMQDRIDTLEADKALLQEKVQNLNQQVAVLKKLAFGPKTEKRPKHKAEASPDQLQLDLVFNEAEKEAKANEPATIEVKAHKRKRKGRWPELLAKQPQEDKVYTLDENERVCDKCGSELHSMGKKLVRREVQFIPAKVKVINIYQETFECRECRKHGHIFTKTKPVPNRVLQHSEASPSTLAHVVVQKYQYSVPLYRQETEWKTSACRFHGRRWPTGSSAPPKIGSCLSWSA